MKDIVTPSELMNLLEALIRAGEPVLIKGAPGVGKTDIVKQACAAVGAALIISHPVVSDPTDYKGMPWVMDGEAKFLPFGDLKGILVGAVKKPTVYFLDDLGQAVPSVQAAAMQLILGRQVNGHEVDPRVTFMAATNRKADRAAVTGILEPVKSRFTTIVELQPDLDDWCAWAHGAGQPTELIAFMRWRPKFIEAFKASAQITNSPCPRTIANLGRLYNIGLPHLSQAREAALVGCVGEEMASEFDGFLRTFDQMPDIEKILQDPANAPIPDDIGVLYALVGALANCAELEGAAEPMVAYSRRLKAGGHPEFAALLIKDCITKGGENFSESAAYVRWAVDHPEIINKTGGNGFAVWDKAVASSKRFKPGAIGVMQEKLPA